MSLRKPIYGLMFLGVALLVYTVLLAGPAQVLADSALQTDTDPSDGCTGTWTFPPLYVGGDDGVVFAQAAYEFDENCQPVLDDQVRLTYVPESVHAKRQKPFAIQTVPIAPPLPPNKDALDARGTEAVNTCHLQTWEEDAPGLDMVAVQIDQTYSWNGSTVTLSNGSISAMEYYSWWYLSSGPSGSAGYHSSQVAYSNGQASFYCNGGPFCGGGPAYNITLYDYMTVDYQGGCGGYGTYSGTVVPFGRVLYNTWK